MTRLDTMSMMSAACLPPRCTSHKIKVGFTPLKNYGVTDMIPDKCSIIPGKCFRICAALVRLCSYCDLTYRYHLKLLTTVYRGRRIALYHCDWQISNSPFNWLSRKAEITATPCPFSNVWHLANHQLGFHIFRNCCITAEMD